MGAIKHILFLTPGFPKDEEDTICLPYFQNYLLALKGHTADFKLTVVSVQYPYSNKKYVWYNIDVFPQGGKNRKGIRKIWLWKNVMKSIAKIHKNTPIHIVHSLWLKECALLGNQLNKRLNIKHICTAMGTEVVENRYFKWLNLRRMKIVAVSPFQKQLILRRFPDIVIRVIPWGISLSDTSYTKPFEERNIDILGVGSLIPLKNYNGFIDIVKELLQKRPDLVIRIIGEGPQKEMLHTAIQKSGFQNNIKLLASMGNQEVQEYMKNSKVLLHTSAFETQGYVFLEALINGMKVVSRKVGIAEESEYWYLAETEEAFQEKIISALQPFQTKVNIPFSMESTVKQYHNLYQS